MGLLGRWALLLSGLFLLPLLLIHAQPYDDGGLRDFLTPPDGCLAPCFIGIQLGETSADDAVAVLDEQPWVLWGDESLKSYRTPRQLSWEWSEAAPVWLQQDAPALATLFDDQVGLIAFQTRISRAEFLLAYGPPDKFRLFPNDDIVTVPPRGVYQYEAWYGDLGVRVLAYGVCSGPQVNF